MDEANRGVVVERRGGRNVPLFAQSDPYSRIRIRADLLDVLFGELEEFSEGEQRPVDCTLFE